MTNIVRRGAVYYFRRRVPDDLQKAIGKALIRESLNTREPVKARTLGAERSAFWERQFEAARLKLAQRHAGKFTRPDLNDDEIAFIVSEYRRKMLWSDEKIRLHGLGGQQKGLPDHQYQLLSEVFLDIEQIAANDLARGRHLSNSNQAMWDSFLRELNIYVKKDSRGYERLAVELLSTHAECIELWKQRHAGKVVRTPPPTPPPSANRPKVTATAILEGWRAERAPKEKTFDTFSAKVRDFEKFLGGRGMNTATATDATEWKASRIAAGKTTKTVANDLYALKAVMGWAKENNKVSSNPFQDVRANLKNKRKGQSIRSYTDQEVKTVLSIARTQKGFKKWIPWINTFTGTRIAEAAQLNIEDFKTESGVWYIDINEDSNDSEKSSTAQKSGIKSVKTEGSLRKVPLHSQLLAEGLIEFVTSRGRRGPLFTDLTPDTYGSRGGTASKRLGRLIRKEAGLIDKRISPCHSSRHKFKDLCRNATIDEEVHDALTGHSDGSVGRKYGDGFLVKVLKPAIEKIKWIDLER